MDAFDHPDGAGARHLLHHLLLPNERRKSESIALVEAQGPEDRQLSYGALAEQTGRLANGLIRLGLPRSGRVAVYLEKRLETVVACFGTAAAGGVFVPVNPVLKPEQVAYILRDCNVSVLVTTPERLSLLAPQLADCPDLEQIILTGATTTPATSLPVQSWSAILESAAIERHRVIDSDMAAILYTSGSTGRPKGVVLSHRNLVTGAKSVAAYLGNHPGDTLLAALPLSFDAGFSQLTTAFHAGARVVLLNYLLPRDVINALVKYRVTGLTAVPPLWIQIAALPWPESIDGHLRYFATTGGRMPQATLQTLRAHVPAARPYLMYGLTEAFRATYLPPEQIDRRPDSIGKAIPNSEILVLREDGSPCGVDEPGELVQRGPLVALGYWNDAERTAERFRPLPAASGVHPEGLTLPEIAVFSGDTVRRDSEGFLYFIGRRDEMIKTSGYRVSPTEVEEVVYATGLVGECAAFGLPHPKLGEMIGLVVTPKPAPENAPELEANALLAACRPHLPAYMLPQHIAIQRPPLPRNPNGKIDRKALAAQALSTLEASSS